MQRLFFGLLIILSANGLFMASATDTAACSKQCSTFAEISRLLKLSETQQCNVSTTCAATWSKFDNYCYKLFPAAGKSFEVAEQLCSDFNNGHLASIHSESEDKFILGLNTEPSGAGIYIGAQNTGSVKGYKWIDGTPFTYTNYGPTQPSGDGQFLHLWRRTTGYVGWNDYLWGGPGLGMPSYFVCKYKVVDNKASITLLQQSVSSLMLQQCDPCNSQPCKNGGSCTSSTATNSYRCNCPDNARGDNCEELVVCTPSTCSVNADCFVQNQQINCVCKPGYTIDERGQCSVKTRQGCMWGDPHYITFDNLKYDYQGTCPYVVTQPCGYDINPYFTVRAQNRQIPNTRVSLVTWAELNIYGYAFKVFENLTMTVDNMPVSVPYQHILPGDPNWSVKAYITAGQMHIITLDHIEIIFYPNTLCVTAPEALVSGTGRLCGLFGDVNNKCQDDMRGKKNNLFGVPPATCVWPNSGPTAVTAGRFGDDWIDDLQSSTCIPGTIMANASLPCTPAEYMAAKQACQAIEQAKSSRGIFARCVQLGATKLDQILESCAYDICADKNLRCSALTTFVRTCQEAVPGAKFPGWRTNVTCPLVCPANQEYSDCVSGCQPTCAKTTSKAVCNKPCIEGCTCSYGTVLDGSGKNCIPQAKCGCTDESGSYHEAGTIWMNAECTRAYKCLEFDKLIKKEVNCGSRGTCSSVNKQHQCTCQSGSTGTCKTAAETIVNSSEYTLCKCAVRTYTIEANGKIDFPGNDITYWKGPFTGCAAACDSTPGCIAYVLHKDNGANCWLKAKLENQTPNPNRHTFQVIASTATVCGCDQWCRVNGKKPGGVCGDGHTCVCNNHEGQLDPRNVCGCGTFCRSIGFPGGICGDGYTCICS